MVGFTPDELLIGGFSLRRCRIWLAAEWAFVVSRIVNVIICNTKVSWIASTYCS